MPFSDIIGHERAIANLKASIANDRVAHAYLFFGEPAIGKRLVAFRFAQAINCETAYGPGGPEACGACRSCRQIESRTHPDFDVMEPDEERSTPQIKIERIRELEQQIIYRPLVGRRKIYLIDQADRMTLAAANALLKTLEEPPTQSLFVLVSDRPTAIPATVRSRCQAVRFTPPARTQVEAALVLRREIAPDDARFLAVVTESRLGEALQADLAALHSQQQEFSALMAEQTLTSLPRLLAAAEALAKTDRALEALEWIARWVRDLVLFKTGADPEWLASIDPRGDWQAVARRGSLEGMLDLLDSLDRFQRNQTRNLNLQLALESVLLRLRDALYADPSPVPVT